MGITPQQSEIIIKYLLGRLTETELEQFEAQFFDDRQVFFDLIETEDRLIRNYLNRELSHPDKQHFEQYYLNLPGKRKKVELALLLEQDQARQFAFGLLNPETEDRESWITSILSIFKFNQPLVRNLALIGSVILVCLSVWALRPRFTSPDQTLSQKTGSLEPSAIMTIESGRPAGPAIVSISLAPVSRRRSASPTETSTQLPTIYTDPGTREIELMLKLEGRIYAKYSGRLQRIEEERVEIAGDDSLKPERKNSDTVVIWRMESTRLTAGDYQVKLRGLTQVGEPGEVNSYDFNIRGH